jgi:hypothetical protein
MLLTGAGTTPQRPEAVRANRNPHEQPHQTTTAIYSIQ